MKRFAQQRRDLPETPLTPHQWWNAGWRAGCWRGVWVTALVLVVLDIAAALAWPPKVELVRGDQGIDCMCLVRQVLR